MLSSIIMFINSDICRVCLTNGIRMLALDDQLTKAYEILTGAKIGDGKLCYICHWQLQKCHRFIKMACNAEQFLKVFEKLHTKVNKNTINNMRSLIKLQTLAIKTLRPLSLPNFRDLSPLSVPKLVPLQQDQVRPNLTKVQVKLNNGETWTMGNEIDKVLIKKWVKETDITEVNDSIDEVDTKEQRVDVAMENCDDIESDTGLEDNVTGVKDSVVITKMYYECGSCSKILKTQEDLTSHKKSHQETEYQNIPETDKESKTERESKKRNEPYHIPKTQVTTEKAITKMYFECGGCSKLLESQEDLAVHQNSHTEDNELPDHYLSGTPALGNSEPNDNPNTKHFKTVNCSVCKKYFNDKFQLMQHFKMHTGQRPFICDTCGKAFRTRYHLKSHFSIHTMEKVYCKVCNKGFTQTSSLGRHMLLHTGEFPYFCHICGRRCKQSGQLRMHIRTVHEGIKEHICEVCNKRFSVKSELHRHMAGHTGIKPFECEDCGIKVTTRTILRRHKKDYCKKP